MPNYCKDMTQQKETLIEFKNVTKRFVIKPNRQLRSYILGKQKKDVSVYGARNLNFSVKRGEIVGLYGPNGSGKSTILRLAAGILNPDMGNIMVGGSIASVIELGAGLHYELTGEENIYLYGTILGISQRDIYSNKEKIISFSGIRKFIKIPIKHYSTGMRARLATAIAIFANTDILLLDEAISVGDGDFREKFIRTIKSIKNKKAILFSTHDIGLLQHLSDTVLVLDHGSAQSTDNEIAIWRIQTLPLGTTFKGKVASNSMYPTLKRGDVVKVNKSKFSAVKKGDIIAFKLGNIPEIVMHRVVDFYKDKEKSYCITKGDSSIGFDVWKVTEDDYLGKVT